jgi:Uma2 family endonuclease
VAETKVRIAYPPVVLEMDEEQFFEFRQLNKGWRIERSAEGDLEVMVPPDFVVELRSSSDPLAPIQAKRREYMENGVHVYRPTDPVEIAHKPVNVSGDPILVCCVLDLEPIWEPGF